jgi:aspartyl-tRNA(Asn)/glutamyl-tRNA(Gln) amidotransferase subunit A
VSRYGLVAFASSLDQVGAFARTVEDAARRLNVIAGHDPLDSTSMPLPVPDYLAALSGDVRGLRIGLPKEYFLAGFMPEC